MGNVSASVRSASKTLQPLVSQVENSVLNYLILFCYDMSYHIECHVISIELGLFMVRFCQITEPNHNNGSKKPNRTVMIYSLNEPNCNYGLVNRSLILNRTELLSTLNSIVFVVN
jgi:hypothetical protein